LNLLLTVDVEEYDDILEAPGLYGPRHQHGGHSSIKTVVPRLLDLLDELGVKGIFFWVGKRVEGNESILRDVLRRGHEVGTHSFDHRCLYEHSEIEFAEDLALSIKTLRDVTGQPVVHYRAPGFSMTPRFYDRYNIVREAGIEFDYSLFAGNASHGGVSWKYDDAASLSIETASGILRSFPFHMSKLGNIKIPAFGGGYFRLLPQFVLRRSVAVASSGLQMFYIHPRDLDERQPRLRGLGLKRQIKSYVGIGGLWHKLAETLRRESFLDPSEYRRMAINERFDRASDFASSSGARSEHVISALRRDSAS